MSVEKEVLFYAKSVVSDAEKISIICHDPDKTIYCQPRMTLREFNLLYDLLDSKIFDLRWKYKNRDFLGIDEKAKKKLLKDCIKFEGIQEKLSEVKHAVYCSQYLESIKNV